MRKCLLLVALLIGAQWTGLSAQVLFDAPDTVCIRQSIQLAPKVTGANSYYWGFCSGYLFNNPVVSNLGPGFGFDTPSGIELVKDGSNYYGFVLSRNDNKLIRLDFINGLNNPPVVGFDFGDLNGTLPPQPNSLSLTRDNGRWYMFISGGNGTASSSIARIDFATSLANTTPNSVNFGNPGNLLNGPRGIFVAEEGGNYYGFAVNALDNLLIRLNFGNNISRTPTAINTGNPAGLSGPSDIAAVLDNGNWYLLIPNQVNNTLSLLTMGNSLTNVPAGTNLGTLGGKLLGPSAVSVVKDCGNYHAFVTNRISNELTRIDIPSLTGPYSATNITAAAGAFSAPADISRVVREKDDVYAFVVNATDNSLTRVAFPQCTSASIPSSTLETPPPFRYEVPGLYNVYLVVNEGQPNAQVECHQIQALEIPQILRSNDTLLCQGDSVELIIQSPNALTYIWSPNYNISDTVGTNVFVHPEYSLNYFIHIPYNNGCIVDTFIRVDVSKNKADAGPDRVLPDGASTVIGGPMTSRGPQFTYSWTPVQFISDPLLPTPVVKPAYDLTYYLTVENTDGCKDIDTVIIHVACNDLNLPNAFAPESRNPSNNRFGLLNRQIVQLNYFRIFDRWGRLVFTTTDATKQWDGTVDGEPAPLGVYVWEADGFCISKERFTRSGNVTLIR